MRIKSLSGSVNLIKQHAIGHIRNPQHVELQAPRFVCHGMSGVVKGMRQKVVESPLPDDKFSNDDKGRQRLSTLKIRHGQYNPSDDFAAQGPRILLAELDDIQVVNEFDVRKTHRRIPRHRSYQLHLMCQSNG